MNKISKRQKKRRAEDRFQEFVRNQKAAKGLLPLTHITRAYAFDDIIGQDDITPQRCSVFSEDLIYFFYGRPSYRAKNGNNWRLEYEWPIIFIFDAKKIGEIKRVFPFDSGAYALKIYEEFFDPKSELSDFCLEEGVESARKIVGAFYQSHKEYFIGNSTKNVDIPHRQFEAQGVHELSKLPGNPVSHFRDKTRDERSSAIELQIGKPFAIGDAVIAIVLPEPYLNDNEVQNALQRWKVKRVESYSTLGNMGGEAWLGQIFGKVQKILEDSGSFDEPNNSI